MRHVYFGTNPLRQSLVARYRQLRKRSRDIFEMVVPDAYFTRPIALRNPIVFYEGHLPAFSVNTLVKIGLGHRGIDERLETLFARGIDPEDEAAVTNPADAWPSRSEVLAYGAEADALVERAILEAPVDDAARPALRGGEAIFTVLEHETMHQETLLYMLHNLPHAQKVKGALATGTPSAATAASSVQGEMIRIPKGAATLGRARGASFGWDNEFEAHRVEVAEFEVAKHNVTNGEFREFVDAGCYSDASLWSEEAFDWIQRSAVTRPHFWNGAPGEETWRGMFAIEKLRDYDAVWVTHAEAAAYARWRQGRLMTEAEYHRAAYGTPSGEEREHPWGDALPDSTRGNFGFQSLDPQSVGSFPAGASAWGVEDLAGNGWEWTSTKFAPFRGFRPMESYSLYSTDFFDDAHYVMKGGSPATSPELIRSTFRNWFRPAYPYIYATFRVARDGVPSTR